MSVTVNDVVTKALREIGKIRATQTISSEDLSTGLQKLNQMLADWEEDGIELGYYPQDAGADVVPIARENEWGVIVNLAVLLAGEFGAPLQPSTVAEAQRTKKRLEKSTVSIVEASMDHLPSGRGGYYNIESDQ